MTIHHDGLLLLPERSLCGDFAAGDTRTYRDTPTCRRCEIILHRLWSRGLLVRTIGGFTRLPREAEAAKDAGPYTRGVAELRAAVPVGVL